MAMATAEGDETIQEAGRHKQESYREIEQSSIYPAAPRGRGVGLMSSKRPAVGLSLLAGPLEERPAPRIKATCIAL